MSQRKPKIMVVEDEPMIALLWQKLLEYRGYEVTLAGDGASALESVVANSVDLLITDLKLPKLNGQNLVRELRSRLPRLPVIVTTGFLELPDDASSLDGIEVLYKPVDPRMLLDLVERMLAAVTSQAREEES